jgi:hypothetical protein
MRDPKPEPTTTAATRRRQAAFVIGALVAIVVVAYLRPLVFGDTFALRDHVTLTVPARANLAEALRAGTVPEWWDGVGLGVPFAANPMHGATYPPAWIIAALPVGFGADLIAILHVLLLGIGTALLARRLGADAMGAIVAGGLMMCSGYTSSMVVNGVPLLSLAWMPWVGWAAAGIADRPGWKSGAVLAAFAAAQVMAGDPAGAITTAWLALLVVGVRAERRWFAVGVAAAGFAAAAVMAAVTIVPALDLLSHSQRARGLSTAEAGAWSMHPLRALEWVWPNALGDPAEPARNLARVYASSAGDAHMDPSWSMSLFVGAPALMLAAVAALRPEARVRALLLGSLAFVVLALGTYTPLYAVYRFFALPERVIRYPERHIAAAMLLWTVCAGVGFTIVFRDAPARRLWRAAAIVAAALAALTGIAAIARSSVIDAVGDGLDGAGAWDAVVSGGATAAIVVGLVATAFALQRSDRYRSLAPALAAAAMVGQLVGHGWETQVLVDRDDVSGVPSILAPLPPPGDGRPRPRLYRHRSTLPRATGTRADLVAALYAAAVANTATRFGFGYAPGYDPAGSARLKAVWEAGAERGGRLLDLFDVEYRVAPGPGESGLAIARQSLRRPRAFVTSRWQWIPSDDAMRDALFGDDFDREAVRLAGAGEPGAGEGIRPCAIESYEPSRVVFGCITSGPGFAVLLDAWAPGWTATVDGHRSPIERADGIVRAVHLDAGAHRIEMSYRTPGLRLGAVVSLLAWLNWAVLLWILRRRGSR